jgi:hypothetical protein
MMSSKSKEVQGLLHKVAELEILLIVLLGILDAKEILSTSEVQALFEAAEFPEILSARVKLIEEEGEALIEARKKFLSEKLRMRPFTAEEKERSYGDSDTHEGRAGDREEDGQELS